jgi:predicted ATPase
MTKSMPPLTIEVTNLKAIRHMRWTPSGVCALVGPNGSGKSTALRVVELVRVAREQGLASALRLLGQGPLRHLDADLSAIPGVRFSLGSAEWTLGLELSRADAPHEQAQDGERVVRLLSHTASFPGLAGSRTYRVEGGGTQEVIRADDGELMLRASARNPAAVPGLVNLSSLISRSRYFSRPDFAFLRENGSPESQDVALASDARNQFTVLKNWKLNSDHEHRSHFVIDSMRELFPSFRNFDLPQLAQRTSALSLGLKEKMPPTDWSDGFFCCLSMLTGLASVEQAVVAFDEPENSLHPELIRDLVELMREWSRQRQTTVLLATHSPVVLDQFREVPEQVFVMEPGHAEMPVPLDQLKKRDWLRNFSLGDLYSHLEVGASTP